MKKTLMMLLIVIFTLRFTAPIQANQLLIAQILEIQQTLAPEVVTPPNSYIYPAIVEKRNDWKKTYAVIKIKDMTPRPEWFIWSSDLKPTI